MLSVVLATYNEASNLKRCLLSVKSLADEIVVVDGSSTDETAKIARSFKAKVVIVPNQTNFHINKQKALSLASHDWILQLDADEEVTPALAEEIATVIRPTPEELQSYSINSSKLRLFLRHQQALERRDGPIGDPKSKIPTAFFIPRSNLFLGRPLRHGGVYPDGVIRLVKKDQAHFPCRSVHEQIHIKGRVSWLEHHLIHHDSPTISKYMDRFNRYTSLQAQDLRQAKTPINLKSHLYYLCHKPKLTFLSIYFRHKGFLDGIPGFIWALLSSLHHPVSYIKYIELTRS